MVPLNKFQSLYQEILTIDKSNADIVTKWNSVASLINNKNEVMMNMYRELIDNDKRNDIEVNYEVPLQQLESQIASEADELYRTCLIVIALHHIVYHYLVAKENYMFMLSGKEQMVVLKQDINYYVYISAKSEQNIYFHAFILVYGLESLFNKHFYVGVDLEYTRHVIELIQLNFEHDVVVDSIVMLVKPTDLESVMLKNFIETVICNKCIKKILHGSDSLDIPYIHEQMLENDPDRMIQFTKAFIDTRFLCEYYKINKNEGDSKCSIYDEDKTRSAIYYFGVISPEQQDKLAYLLEFELPPVHDITWNIHKMNEAQKKYAVYDVIYLKYFYYRMIYVASMNEPTDAAKKTVIDLYKHVLYELTQFIYLEQRKITSVTDKCKEEVDPVNNYMIRKPPNTIIKLVNIYEQVSIDIITTDPQVHIDNLYKVNHFKKRIQTIIKKMIYTVISKKCTVYKNKTTLWTDKLDNQYIFDFMQKMQYPYLYKMFKDIQRVIDSRITTICKI